MTVDGGPRVLFAEDQWREASGMAVTGSLERRPVITSSVHAPRMVSPHPHQHDHMHAFYTAVWDSVRWHLVHVSLCEMMLPTQTCVFSTGTYLI